MIPAWQPTAPPAVDPTWAVTRTCTGCGASVEVFEAPIGYLNDPYWGPYLCGDCACVSRPG